MPHPLHSLILRYWHFLCYSDLYLYCSYLFKGRQGKCLILIVLLRIPPLGFDICFVFVVSFNHLILPTIFTETFPAYFQLL